MEAIIGKRYKTKDGVVPSKLSNSSFILVDKIRLGNVPCYRLKFDNDTTFRVISQESWDLLVTEYYGVEPIKSINKFKF